MDCKKYVVNINLSRLADGRINSPLEVINCVKVKPSRVEHRKFQREPCDTLRKVVLVSLGVKTEGPEYKTSPPTELL